MTAFPGRSPKANPQTSTWQPNRCSTRPIK